jgi:hypothetical protein
MKKTKEIEIIEACDSLKMALLKQLKNFSSQEKLKIEEIKLRKEVLDARFGVSNLRE